MMRILAFFVFAMFVFSSCKKDFTCTCTFSNGEMTETAIEDQTQKEAESSCSEVATSIGAASCTL